MVVYLDHFIEGVMSLHIVIYFYVDGSLSPSQDLSGSGSSERLMTLTPASIVMV